jgi:hypothetical protein
VALEPSGRLSPNPAAEMPAEGTPLSISTRRTISARWRDNAAFVSESEYPSTDACKLGRLEMIAAILVNWLE